MAKYFVDPYKNYYEKLSAASSLTTDGTTAVSDISSATGIVSQLQSQLEVSKWKELGYDELVTSVIPSFKARFDTLSANIAVLNQACSEAISGLLPILVDLKEKDEKLEETINELNNLTEPSPKYESVYRNGKYVQTNNVTDAYAAYEQRKSELEVQRDTLDSEALELVENANNKVESIKALNANIKDFGDLSTGTTVEIEGLELTETEEAILSALENAVEDTTTEHSALDATAVDTSVYGNGRTILLNDAGSREEGYSRQVITSHGKLVTVFQQAWNDNLRYLDHNGWTIRTNGCGYNALASILSSKYPGITPEYVFCEIGGKFMYAGTIKTYLESRFNIPVGSREEVPRSDYQAYRQHLITEVSKGNMVMCTVQRGPDAKYTQKSHWVAIVDYDPATDSFYVTDSNDQKDKNAGPIDVDTFLKKYSVNTNVIYIADTSGYKG